MSSLKLFFYFLKALRHNFFQLWSDDTSSIKNIQGEYMVVRPATILAIRVEPIFFGSVDRTE